MLDTRQLLEEYKATGSEEAFRNLVEAYIGLVYSAAARLLNNDAHLAEDVSQTVFADFARLAKSLSPKIMIGGWLHRHTCFVAHKTLRRERRRQLREQHAFEMNSNEEPSGEDLALIAPLLDDAIDQLAADDRTAILLRYFEQRDYRAVGHALGTTEEAARKRVNRALDKLQQLLKRRGVALPVATLGSIMAAQALTAAPVGLGAGIAAGALAGTGASSAAVLTTLKIMSLTKMQAGMIAAVAVIVAVPLVVQHQTQTRLRQENVGLRHRLEEMDRVIADNQRLSNLIANAAAPRAAAAPTSNEPSPEVLRLRGEVGRLRQEQAGDAATRRTNTPLSSLTSNPEMLKMIRMQQKAGMSMIYKDFVKRNNLPSEQAEKLNELLADHVMENIDRVTTVLREGKSNEEIDQVFKAQEASLEEGVKGLLGPESFAQFRDYTHNLASSLTAEQFKPQLTGDDESRQQRTKQLYELMQQETQAALTSAGLSPDFQVVPSLNFRNFASEAEAEKNLKLLDDIYEKVAARAGAFLSAEDLKKFGEFRAKAIENNRMALSVNRKLMTPSSK